MAAVLVLDGALASGASTAWATVAASRSYTVQLNGTGTANLALEATVDGTNKLSLLRNKLVNVSDNTSDNKVFTLTDVPVAAFRVTNNGSASVTAKVYAISA